jgi:hypothetical protein
MSDRLDLGAWVGIISLALAIPVGVLSHVIGQHFSRYLEKRKLVKGDSTRRQAIAAYNRVKAFHNRTRDRYPYYMLLAGWAAICAVASSTNIILIVLIYPDISTIETPPPSGLFVLVLLAVLFGILAVVLLFSLYDISRHLDRFEDYKAALEQQWGSIDE